MGSHKNPAQFEMMLRKAEARLEIKLAEDREKSKNKPKSNKKRNQERAFFNWVLKK